jgi:hypothetical protein
MIMLPVAEPASTTGTCVLGGAGHHHGIDMRERRAQRGVASVCLEAPGQIPQVVFPAVNEHDFGNALHRMQP